MVDDGCYLFNTTAEINNTIQEQFDKESKELLIVSSLFQHNQQQQQDNNTTRTKQETGTATTKAMIIQPLLQVQVYQTLLVHGVQTPVWLRKRICVLLNDIACQNLYIIIQVFVHDSHNNDKTSAMLRLAKVLSSYNSNNSTNTNSDEKQQQNEKEQYYKLLCIQLMSIVNDITDFVNNIRCSSSSKNNKKKKDDDNWKNQLTKQQVLNIYTIWSIIDQLPMYVIDKYLTPQLINSNALLFNTNDVDDNSNNSSNKSQRKKNTRIHYIVRRIIILLSFLPSNFMNSTSNAINMLYRIFLLPISDTTSKNNDDKSIRCNENTENNTDYKTPAPSKATSTNLFGILIRLASIQSTIFKSNMKQDSQYALHIFFQIIDKVIINNNTKNSTSNSNDVLFPGTNANSNNSSTSKHSTAKQSVSITSNNTKKKQQGEEEKIHNEDENKVNQNKKHRSDINKNSSYFSCETLAMMILYSLAPTQWDFDGYVYKLELPTLPTSPTTTSPSSSENGNNISNNPGIILEEQRELRGNNSSANSNEDDDDVLEGVIIVKEQPFHINDDEKHNENTNRNYDDDDDSEKLCESIYEQKQQHQSALEKLQQTVEQRATMVIKELVVPLSSSSNSSSDDDGDDSTNTITTLSNLPFHMLLLLLWIYFSSSSSSSVLFSSNQSNKSSTYTNVNDDNFFMTIPLLFRNNIRIFQIVTMILLPLLCQDCPLESLLLMNNDSDEVGSKYDNTSASNSSKGAIGIFELMRLVFLCCAQSRYYCHNDNGIHSSNIGKGKDIEGANNDNSNSNAMEEQNERFRLGGKYLSDIVEIKKDINSSINTKEVDGNAAKTGNRREADSIIQQQQPQDDDALLLSILSIILSLLIAVLELGTTAGKRPPKEENMLQSFLGLLRPFAEEEVLPSFSYNSSDTGNRGNNENDQTNANVNEGSISAIYSEISEMASHAMALIASRQVQDDEEKVSTALLEDDCANGKSNSNNLNTQLEDLISKVEIDLKSTQAPLRARGVVALRHLVRGGAVEHLLQAKGDGSHSSAKKRQLITVIDEEEEEEGVEKSPFTSTMTLLLRILELAIGALADDESYVYLAAVHTIVAAADVCPKEILPRVGIALMSGIFTSSANIDCAPASTSTNPSFADREEEGIVRLLPHQKVKLAESLIFIIRRRAAIYEYIPLLVKMMVMGVGDGDNYNGGDIVRVSKGDSQLSPADKIFEMAKMIQSQTHNYFVKGRTVDDDDEQESEEEDQEEVDIRIRAGGPLFDVEEDDTVRAAKINVLAELVAASNSNMNIIIAKYCPIFVQLVIVTLRLDNSRPVRRSAAFLAKELYRSVLREQNELFEILAALAYENTTEYVQHGSNVINAGNDSDFAPMMAVELVSSGQEEVLRSTLEWSCRYAAGFSTSNDDQDSKINDNNEQKDKKNKKNKNKNLKKVKSKKYHRLYDQATVSRCKEALALREEVDGVMMAAQILIQSNHRMEQVPQFLLLEQKNSNRNAIKILLERMKLGSDIRPNASS